MSLGSTIYAAIFGASDLGHAVGQNLIYVDTKQALSVAINSITDNLVTTYTSGTVAVTNGSAVITFSSAVSNNTLVAGRSLIRFAGSSRYYQIKNGPPTAARLEFTLYENYQGATNAAASFEIIEPNPYTIVLMPGVYDYTTDALATNIPLKPYVSLAGLDRASTIIRRNKNNPTPTTTPLIALHHGCVLSNLSIDTVDGHFNHYRMGLSAYATSQTQAMAGSRWGLRNCALLNKDPNGIDSGADYAIDSSHYNGDILLMEDCYYEHCWDGFNYNTQGGRLKVLFVRPTIYKTPIPQNKNASGATFMRAGITAASTTDVEMYSPFYDQETFSAAETIDDGIGGLLANNTGTYGCAFVGHGASLRVFDPVVRMDVGTQPGRQAAFGLAHGSNVACNASTMIITGGHIRVKGTGAAGGHTAGILGLANGSANISSVDIETDDGGINASTPVYSANGETTVNLRGGSRIHGTVANLVNGNASAPFNKSANVSLSATGGANVGTITALET